MCVFLEVSFSSQPVGIWEPVGWALETENVCPPPDVIHYVSTPTDTGESCLISFNFFLLLFSTLNYIVRLYTSIATFSLSTIPGSDDEISDKTSYKRKENGTWKLLYLPFRFGLCFVLLSIKPGEDLLKLL